MEEPWHHPLALSLACAPTPGVQPQGWGRQDVDSRAASSYSPPPSRSTAEEQDLREGRGSGHTPLGCKGRVMPIKVAAGLALNLT